VYDLIIRDATIISSTGRLVADIGIEEGKIAYIGSNPAGAAKEESQGIGRFVMPGVIDSKVYFHSPDDPQRPDWANGSRAAVSAGVTTVLDMPDGPLHTSGAKEVEAKLAAAQADCVANFGAWMAVNQDNISELEDVIGSGKACAPMIRMDYEEGPLAVDDACMARVLASSVSVVGINAEDPGIIRRQTEKWSEVDDPIHNDVRPPKAAARALERVIEMVRETEKAAHICSLSTASELNILDPIRGDLPITVGVSPYHLFLSVETSAKLGDSIKVNPPVRTELDRRALWASAKRGRIDLFSSGHSPYLKARKQGPYWDVPPGIPGVDTMFPLLMSAVKHGRLGLERLVQMCCEAPAELFGLQNKGRIEEGFDADLILISEGETARLKKAPEYSGVGWSPYVGREVGVSPELVVVCGRVVSRSGLLVDEIVPGQPVVYSR
jgi:dihydroorotase